MSTIEDGAVDPLRLTARLLGDSVIALGDRPASPIGAARLRSLLAYLIIHYPAPQPRRRLAALFWPDMPEARASNNLRQLIYQLRQQCPGIERLLRIDGQQIGWQTAIALDADVRGFAEALALADRAEESEHMDAAQAALERAAGCYGGDLLPDCDDEWVGSERERLFLLWRQSLARLIHILERRGDVAAAIGYAQTLARSDPLDEAAAASLIRLLAAGGNRAGARRAFLALADALERELGVAPSAELRALDRRVQAPETVAQHVLPAVAQPLAGSALIGRRREWGLLYDAWQRADAGSPQIALISGEAGIGKSRLAEELFLRVGGERVAALARCYASEGRLALGPLIAWLASARLRPHLAGLPPIWRTEVARVLPEVAPGLPDALAPAPISEYGQRQRFFEALARAVLAAPPPLLLIIDDLQWCDQETIEWLHVLLRFDPAARLLVVATLRDDELADAHPARALIRQLRRGAGLTEIGLRPLDAAETAQLAAQISGRELDDAAAMRLFREAEGNPLFVVELIQAGDLPLATAERALPAPIQAVIAGRLAQLSEPTRAVARLAATIGREFGIELLAEAGGLSDEQVVVALDELWRRRIIREQGAGRYDFSHDKLREVAYAQISVPQRRMLHRRIALALELRYAAEADARAAQIAAHYDQAGMAAAALPCYERAIAVARRIFANEDAIALLQRALAVIDQLPPGPERDTRELRLQLALSAVYRIVKGWTAPELERALERARVLCTQCGDDVQWSQLLYGLQALYVVQARFDKVLRVSEELRALHDRTRDDPLPMFGFISWAGTQLHQGHAVAANDAFERTVAERESASVLTLEDQQSWSYTIHALAWQAHALWYLGRPGPALALAHMALARADELRQPFNQALAAAYLATLLQLVADEDVFRAAAARALALAGEHRIPYYRAWSQILVAYAEVVGHPDDARLDRLRAAIDEFCASGARLRLPYYLALLAEALGRAGKTDAALATLAQATDAAVALGECWWDAELLRLRGELRHAGGIPGAAADLTRALAVARAQGALALELRAAVSLLRLRPDAPAARARLKQLLAAFAADANTRDLRAARALLTPG